ncbi:MAG: ATP-binding SpoIIE family protein phosphatase [Symbiobacteriia bacterium]
MAVIRWQMRLLFLGLLLTGLVWIHFDNYVRLGTTPLDMLWWSAAVFWGGALVIGWLLDWLASRTLRKFYSALAKLQAGDALTSAERTRAAWAAISFPERASAFLIVMAVILTLAFHAVDFGGELLAALADPVARTELLNIAGSELSLALALAILLFTLSRRLLQRAVAELGLREAPPGRRLSLKVPLWLLMLAQAVLYTTVFVTTPAGFSPARALLLYLPMALLSLLGGYVVAADAARNLEAVTGRLRVLAAGLRPDLFHRLAVTGHDEVADLVTAINGLQDRVESEFHTLQRDIQAARTIQMGMLPRDLSVPQGWNLAAHLAPAEQVGGDFYDVLPLGEGRYGLAVGDAAGKGLPAALLMASTVSLLRSHAPLHERPGEVLETVNRMLCSSVPPMTFVTAAYVVMDTQRWTVTVASAGHPPPIIGGREAEAVPSLPLGVDPLSRYAETTYELAPGQPFLLYSDGLVESWDRSHNLLGTERVESLMTRGGLQAREFVRDLITAAEKHAAGQAQWDDMTVLVLLPPDDLRLELPSRHGSELIAAERAAWFSRRVGCGSRADDVATAVAEVCLNAVVHGNGLNESLSVSLRLQAGGGWLEALVTDCGAMFTPSTSPPDLQAQMEGDCPIHGWGLHLVRSTADEMRVEPLADGQSGKQVRLRFRCGDRGEGSVDAEAASRGADGGSSCLR